MADSYIAIDEPAVTDKKLDTEQITVGANTVERERFILTGTGATDIVKPVAHDAVDAGNPLPIGGYASNGPPTAVSADGDRVKAWFSLNGALNVSNISGDALTVADGGATLSIDDGGGTISVDGNVGINVSLPAGPNNIGDVDIASMPNVTLAAGTNTNEVVGDVSHDSVAAGNPVLVGAYASGAAPVDVSADGDAVRIWALKNGALAVQPTLSGALAVGGNGVAGVGVQRVTIANDSTGVLATVSTVTTVSTLSGGGVAHDGADSGNPVKVGAKASLTLSDDTIVANGDRTDLTSDGDGAVLVRSNFPLGDLISEAVSNTDGNSTALTNFGATASTRSYVTAISVFRTDAGATAAYIDFRDGTAGSVLYRMPLPPNGGSVIASPHPLFRTTANTALAFDVSAALTTVYISLTGFKSKV